MAHRALLSCLLAATAASAQAAEPAAEPYRANGSDPAWSLTIADGRMIWESPGKPPVTVATPSAANEDGVIRYNTDKLIVSIMPIACTDRASGRRYAESVFVTLLERPRTGDRGGADSGTSLGNLRAGCGGTELPADSLNGTSWHFAEIAGESTGLTGDLLRDDIYAIDFHADGFVGYGGCNRFSAGYERTGDVLIAKPPLGRGMRGCREPIMSRERRLIAILTEPVRIAFPDSKTMVLTGDKGSIKLLRIEEQED